MFAWNVHSKNPDGAIGSPAKSSHVFEFVTTPGGFANSRFPKSVSFNDGPETGRSGKVFGFRTVTVTKQPGSGTDVGFADFNTCTVGATGVMSTVAGSSSVAV